MLDWFLKCATGISVECRFDVYYMVMLISLPACAVDCNLLHNTHVCEHFYGWFFLNISLFSVFAAATPYAAGMPLLYVPFLQHIFLHNCSTKGMWHAVFLNCVLVQYHTNWVSSFLQTEFSAYSVSCNFRHWMIGKALVMGNWLRGLLDITSPSTGSTWCRFWKSNSARLSLSCGQLVWNHQLPVSLAYYLSLHPACRGSEWVYLLNVIQNWAFTFFRVVSEHGKLFKNLMPVQCVPLWKHERLVIGLWSFYMFLVVILCTVEFLWNFYWLFIMEFINKNMCLDQRAEVSDLLNELLHEFLGFVLTITL
jgi:hypothetical protein